jgi:ferredoxin
MSIEAKELFAALGTNAADQPGLKRQMCQRELSGFNEDLIGDVVVACTQEAKLLGEVGGEKATVSTMRFVNIRETAGWGKEGKLATPKIAALLAQAMLPDPEPTTQVSYASKGETLIVGDAKDALAMAQWLKPHVNVSVLLTDTSLGKSGADLTSLPREFAIISGANVTAKGWLGAFDVSWSQANPIDLDACVRCGACVAACPENAISDAFQINMDACKSHRSCVAACDTTGAISFDRKDETRNAKFDVIVDLGAAPLFAQHQPPQGYVRAVATDATAQMKALAEVVGLIGEFEKPKFFNYKANVCAHSRNKKTGCTQCIDVCSTKAIKSAGEKIEVTPQLCMGCGACTTVCPSGALTYVYPRVSDMGARVKAALNTYAKAGGKDAALLLYDAESGVKAIAALARKGDGLPARVIPIEVHHPASVGMDVWLGAIAYGASEVLVHMSDAIAPEYATQVAAQMKVADTILNGLGYQGEHFAVLPDVATVWSRQVALSVRTNATFNLTNDKRTTLDMVFDHLAQHAPVPAAQITLPAGAAYGAIAVNTDKCTMCMSCVGACPEGAINDNPEAPQLRFIERKCVQCGLCVKTCPETAIALVPRLNLQESAKKPQLINEAKLFNCTKCGKAMGPERMIQNMIAKLAGHSMFASDDQKRRLTMCGDCRVVDLYTDEKPLDIRDLK